MKLEPIAGLGKAAFSSEMFGMGTSLSLFRGDYDYVQLMAMNTGDAEASRSAGLQEIVKLVLDRWK